MLNCRYKIRLEGYNTMTAKRRKEESLFSLTGYYAIAAHNLFDYPQKAFHLPVGATAATAYPHMTTFRMLDRCFPGGNISLRCS